MENITKSVKLLDNWIEKNGWAGFDPYDIRGEQVFLKLQKNKYLNISANLILKYFPMSLRKVFRVKKTINAKGMGLFARGYLKLYRKLKKKSYLKKALFCLNWLIRNPSKGYHGMCWGYPFDWQSRIFIPARTPSGVVTSSIAHAFIDAYEELNDEKYPGVAKSCCKFMLYDLNIDKIGNDKICFSYTPLDKFHIHNANILVSSVLLRTYAYTKERKFKDSAIKAINFTVSHQNKDGSWYYWAPPDELVYNIDNYHTGFVLEGLNIARRVLKDEFKYKSELVKGVEFYDRTLFVNKQIAKYNVNNVFPIDIHSCAQGIITFSELKDLKRKYIDNARSIARWTIKEMQDSTGYFYYRRYKTYKDKTPFIRWGQGWMLRALSYIV
ncbi:MAG: hypothetical protein ACTSQY_08275 [Candidatus Odinarchaeia archaeon]